MKRSPTKISYAWISAITQEPKKNPIAFLERVQIATNTFNNRKQEREVKDQEKERRKETKLAQMLVTLQRCPMMNGVLKGQGTG